MCVSHGVSPHGFPDQPGVKKGIRNVFILSFRAWRMGRKKRDDASRLIGAATIDGDVDVAASFREERPIYGTHGDVVVVPVRPITVDETPPRNGRQPENKTRENSQNILALN